MMDLVEPMEGADDKRPTEPFWIGYLSVTVQCNTYLQFNVRLFCSTINYLSNGVNILAGNDSVSEKFGPKGTDPQQEGCAFHVSHAERCALGVSRPSCCFILT